MTEMDKELPICKQQTLSAYSPLLEQDGALPSNGEMQQVPEVVNITEVAVQLCSSPRQINKFSKGFHYG